MAGWEVHIGGFVAPERVCESRWVYLQDELSVEVVEALAQHVAHRAHVTEVQLHVPALLFHDTEEGEPAQRRGRGSAGQRGREMEVVGVRMVMYGAACVWDPWRLQSSA